MYYEINISKDGAHFFATSERSIQGKAKLKVVYETMVEKFPESEGYEIEVSYMVLSGRPVSPAEAVAGFQK